MLYLLYHLQHPSFHSAQHPLLPSQWTVRPLTHTVSAAHSTSTSATDDHLTANITRVSKINHEHNFPRILPFAYE